MVYKKNPKYMDESSLAEFDEILMSLENNISDIPIKNPEDDSIEKESTEPYQSIRQRSTDCRKYRRIPFPVQDRPTLSVEMASLLVDDLSESGLRAKLPRGMDFKEDEEVVADLTVFDGTTYKIRGKVVREHQYYLILHFKEFLPYSLIANLQKYLLNKYSPNLLGAV